MNIAMPQLIRYFAYALLVSGALLTATSVSAQSSDPSKPVLTDIFGTQTTENDESSQSTSSPQNKFGPAMTNQPANVNSPAITRPAGRPSGVTGIDNSGTESLVRRGEFPPSISRPTGERLPPYGSQLFDQNNLVDRAIGVNPSYTIKQGDRISVQIWGAWIFENILTVDIQGNIFLPEIGPIRVAGLKNAALTGHVRGRMSEVFKNNVNVYTNLLGTQPIRVYISGAVPSPGYYPGESSDTILYYLARAGGVDLITGSYRNIQVIRNGKPIETIDLYRFLLNGIIPQVSFQPNDTIFVNQRQSEFSASGGARNAYSFELPASGTFGRDLINLARPGPLSSYVLLTGQRSGKAYSSYLSIKDFANVPLLAGDIALFEEDLASDTITVSAVGRSGGASQFTIPQTTKLATLLRMIQINPEAVNTKAIHLRRKSVAERQKLAIQRSLYELQRSVLTGTAESSSGSEIRVKEAALVESFVSKVQAAEPQGRVVIAGTDWENISLENGDEIVIPQKTDLVLVSGEVKLPQSIVWRKSWDLDDYVENSGGISNRGDTDNLLVLHADGSASTGNRAPQKGDHIMVLPESDTKYFAMFKDMIEIIYRVALSTAVVINVQK